MFIHFHVRTPGFALGFVRTSAQSAFGCMCRCLLHDIYDGGMARPDDEMAHKARVVGITDYDVKDIFGTRTARMFSFTFYASLNAGIFTFSNAIYTLLG